MIARWSVVHFTSKFEARAFDHEFIKGLLTAESFLDLDVYCAGTCFGQSLLMAQNA